MNPLVTWTADELMLRRWLRTAVDDIEPGITLRQTLLRVLGRTRRNPSALTNCAGSDPARYCPSGPGGHQGLAGPGRDQTQGPARSWTIELPAGQELLNANDRLHYMAKARLTRTIRETAGWIARAAKIPPLSRVRVVAEYRPPDRRRRDAHNLYPSIKAAIDGALVDAGILPDDSDEYLVGVEVCLGDVRPGGQLVLHITEIPEETPNDLD